MCCFFIEYGALSQVDQLILDVQGIAPLVVINHRQGHGAVGLQTHVTGLVFDLKWLHCQCW